MKMADERATSPMCNFDSDVFWSIESHFQCNTRTWIWKLWMHRSYSHLQL